MPTNRKTIELDPLEWLEIEKLEDISKEDLVKMKNVLLKAIAAEKAAFDHYKAQERLTIKYRLMFQILLCVYTAWLIYDIANGCL